MKKARMVQRLSSGSPIVEGAGVKLTRYFGSRDIPRFDPFLLLDDFSSNNRKDFIKGFPWHPHRGIETITYVLDGAIEHSDSLNNKGTVASGEVQWMTAGSGIIHQEMPLDNVHHKIRGFQLWLNLPSNDKFTAPLYQSVSAATIPQLHPSDKSVYRIIAGSFDSEKGPVIARFGNPFFFDITLPAETEFVCPTPPTHNVFAYLFEGAASFGVNATESEDNDSFSTLPLVEQQQVILFSKGDFITVSTRSTPARFLLAGGHPLGEPVAWYGPIVMNTKEELQSAFREFQIGTFIMKQKKHPTSVA